MVVDGITTLDMSGTTEVPGITIPAVAAGTRIHGIRVNATGASIDAVAKIYENYKQVKGSINITAGDYTDLKFTVPLDVAIAQVVAKFTPASGGAVDAPFDVRAVVENISTADCDTLATQVTNLGTSISGLSTMAAGRFTTMDDSVSALAIQVTNLGLSTSGLSTMAASRFTTLDESVASLLAETVFVSSAGSDSTGTGTIDAPYLTLYGAYGLTSPGATIVVCDLINAKGGGSWTCSNRNIVGRGGVMDTYKSHTTFENCLIRDLAIEASYSYPPIIGKGCKCVNVASQGAGMVIDFGSTAYQTILLRKVSLGVWSLTIQNISTNDVLDIDGFGSWDFTTPDSANIYVFMQNFNVMRNLSVGASSYGMYRNGTVNLAANYNSATQVEIDNVQCLGTESNLPARVRNNEQWATDTNTATVNKNLKRIMEEVSARKVGEIKA